MSNQESNDQQSKRSFEPYYNKFLQYYEEKWPFLFHICYDPVGQHESIRKVFRFILGLLLGLSLYFFIIADFKLNKYTNWICFTTLVILLSTGCTYSLQFRCVCLLTIPGFFGRAGRSVLKALILGYIIAGPIFNLSFNTKEVMRSFACTSQLTYNMTKTRYDLMLAPFQQTMKNLNESAGEIKEALGSMNEVMKPLAHEIEDEEFDEDDEHEFNDDDDGEVSGFTDELPTPTPTATDVPARERRDDSMTAGEQYEEKYREKISNRCKKQLRKGSESCRESFRDAYNRCHKTVTWVAAWILCWPMKLTFACNVIQSLGGNVCNPEGKLDAGFGEGYAILKETRDKLNESLSDAQMSYKIDTKAMIMAQAKDASRAAAGVMRDFEARKRFLDLIITFIKRCLSIVFLKIILNALKYHSNYLMDIQHDNIYITPYYRRIDARRRARDAATLLPLKKLERTKLIDPFEMRQTKQEKRHLFGQTAKLLLEVITVSTFVLLDKLLFDLLDVIRKHARLEITQSGRHDISLDIKGKGLVANLVRKLVHGIDRKRQVTQLLSNEACLPRPGRVPRSYLLAIYLGYLVVWLFLYLQAYGQRLRPAIAAFFYRKREKRRVLHLYNENLRRRRGFLRWIRSRAAQAARSRLLAPEAHFWLELRDSRPELWAWLRRLGLGRSDCSICGDPEPRRGQHHLCRAPNCLAAYCEECWRELGRSCWGAGCAPGAPIDHNDDDDIDEDGY